MTIDEMLKTGDRVEWRKFLRKCTVSEAALAWVKALKAKIPDMQETAYNRMRELDAKPAKGLKP